MNRSRSAAATLSLVALGLALSGCSSAGGTRSAASVEAAPQPAEPFEHAGRVQIVASDAVGMAAFRQSSAKTTAFVPPAE